MIFLQPEVPVDLLDVLISYDYRSLKEEYVSVAEKRYSWRVRATEDRSFASVKVPFFKNCINLGEASWSWVKTVNLVYSNGVCPIDGEKMSHTRVHDHTVLDKSNKTLVFFFWNKIDKIRNLIAIRI